MKRYAYVFSIVNIFFLALARAEELSGPEKNFKYLWKSRDQRWALCLLLRLDWNLLYCVC